MKKNSYVNYDDHACMHELLHSYMYRHLNSYEFDQYMIQQLKNTDHIIVNLNMYTIFGLGGHFKNLVIDYPHIKNVTISVDRRDWNSLEYIPLRYTHDLDSADRYSWLNNYISENILDVKDHLTFNCNFSESDFKERTHMNLDHYNKNIKYIKSLRWKDYDGRHFFQDLKIDTTEWGFAEYIYSILKRYNKFFNESTWDNLVSGN